MSNGIDVSPLVDIENLSHRLRTQFAGKLLDLRFEHKGAVASIYQPRLQPDAGKYVHRDAAKYNIGCIQTVIEGIVVALLCQDGIIDISAPIGFYLPDLICKVGPSPGEKIFVRDLLSHSTGYHAPSGIASMAGFDDWSSIVQYLKHTPQSFPAGTVCSWNGLGRSLLGPLVHRVTGKNIETLVKLAISNIGRCDPSISDIDSGWPEVFLSLDGLSAFFKATIGRGGIVEELITRLPSEKVRVVRCPVSSRSGSPIAYAFGFAQYADGLWGQSGNTPDFALGMRFDEMRSSFICLALGAPPYSRDLLLQYLAAVCGYIRKPSPPEILGSILSCSLDELAGIYAADLGDKVEVTISAPALSCTVSRQGKTIATIDLHLTEDGLLRGDARWSALQIEFFPHPETMHPCLMLGQVAYLKLID